jgi:superfamily II DNA or RNA helicase
LHKGKIKIQEKAEKLFYKNNLHGLLAMCTGSGKSKIFINIHKKLQGKWLLVVPTEKLRDNNWLEEFKKWDYEKGYFTIDRVCYASLNKIKDLTYDGVCLDEAHNITENNIGFFKNNVVKAILGLTATIPKDENKRELLSSLIPTIFSYSLDEGVRDGVVSQYKINVINCRLDGLNKNVLSGSKNKPFYTTELMHYNYLTKKINDATLMFGRAPMYMYLNRMHFIYNLKSKTELAKKLSLKLNGRYLIFASSKQQAFDLCSHRFYTKPDKLKQKKLFECYNEDKDLIDFINGKINKLSCVESLNEGINIPNIDSIIVTQINSNDKNLIQRIGRAVRFRPEHIANIYILCCENTVDQEWLNKSLVSFNEANIKYNNESFIDEL